MNEVTAADLQALLGAPELPAICAALAREHDLRYGVPTQAERDDIIRRVIAHTDSDKPTRVGEHRAEIWESCWSENLQKFVEGGYDSDALVPDFIRPGEPVRFRRDYVVPHDPRFELHLFQVLRAYLFERFFAKLASVYEFGCGSGFNLLALAYQYPGKRLCGLDWSRSSNEMLNLMGKKLEIEITGRHFDFFRPDRALEFEGESGVLTMCALEQVGERYGPFLEFLLEKRPSICVNMEPLVELYDERNLVDYLAIRFHRKRGYLEGMLPALRRLESERRIEILETRRLYFGSIYHEGYSYVAWRPL